MDKDDINDLKELVEGLLTEDGHDYVNALVFWFSDHKEKFFELLDDGFC